MRPIRNTKKVIRIANSMGVVIDKSIAKSMKLERGDLVEFSFKKIGKKLK
jgi:antitoxin component of MazEF toxin-antitoxin module